MLFSIICSNQDPELRARKSASHDSVFPLIQSRIKLHERKPSHFCLKQPLLQQLKIFNGLARNKFWREPKLEAYDY
tara:strand:+ start:562 stop:789 length:228 start_codon:yes stop_codon:yes gene_type:complete